MTHCLQENNLFLFFSNMKLLIFSVKLYNGCLIKNRTLLFFNLNFLREMLARSNFWNVDLVNLVMRYNSDNQNFAYFSRLGFPIRNKFEKCPVFLRHPLRGVSQNKRYSHLAIFMIFDGKYGWENIFVK